MPTPKELPEDLEELAHKNAVELVDRWWRWGMLELFEALEGIVGPPKPDSLPNPQAKAEPRDDVEAERVQFRHKQALEQFFLERGVRAYLYKKQIERLQRERGGEPILEVVEADPTDTTSNVTGLLAATPSRLIYVREKIIGLKTSEYAFERLARVSATPFGFRGRHTEIRVAMFSGEVARFIVRQSSRERVQALLNAVHARTEDDVVKLSIT